MAVRNNVTLEDAIKIRKKSGVKYQLWSTHGNVINHVVPTEILEGKTISETVVVSEIDRPFLLLLTLESEMGTTLCRADEVTDFKQLKVKYPQLFETTGDILVIV